MQDDQFLGELRVFSFNFAPKGWVQCNGGTLPILQNQALYALLGTTYGGDGRSTFGIPNLMGSTPIHTSPVYTQGSSGGEAAHTLQLTEIPVHNHYVTADTVNADPNTGSDPTTTSIFAASNNAALYAPAANLAPMAATTIGMTGGGGSHDNMSPYTTLNVCMAIVGVFPTRN